MIKYNNKLKRKFQVKLMSRDGKPKQRINANKQTNKQTNRKNNRNLKAMGNITPTIDNYPKNERMRDIDRQPDISC